MSVDGDTLSRIDRLSRRMSPRVDHAPVLRRATVALVALRAGLAKLEADPLYKEEAPLSAAPSTRRSERT